MKAIMTRYHGANATRPDRITAREQDGRSATVSYDPGRRPEENHRRAARALCRKMGWTGRLVGPGGLRRGCVFVFAP